MIAEENRDSRQKPKEDKKRQERIRKNKKDDSEKLAIQNKAKLKAKLSVPVLAPTRRSHGLAMTEVHNFCQVSCWRGWRPKLSLKALLSSSFIFFQVVSSFAFTF